MEVKRYYQDNLEAFVDYQHVFANVLLEFDTGRRRARSRAKVINPCGMHRRVQAPASGLITERSTSDDIAR